MRMWMLPPEITCIQHRVGEHGELHKHLPSLRRGIGVHGRFHPVVQIQFKGFVERHDQLAASLKGHKSPLVDVPDFSELYPEYYDLTVDPRVSMQDLMDRCPACRKLIAERIPKWQI